MVREIERPDVRTNIQDTLARARTRTHTQTHKQVYHSRKSKLSITHAHINTHAHTYTHTHTHMYITHVRASCRCFSSACAIPRSACQSTNIYRIYRVKNVVFTSRSAILGVKLYIVGTKNSLYFSPLPVAADTVPWLVFCLLFLLDLLDLHRRAGL